MHVLVVGGTGFIGTHLCRELHDRGHEVTALSRSPDSADLPSGVRTVMGDVTAYDSMEGAFEGQDAVVNLVALSPLFRPSGGNEMHFRVHEGGTANVVRAAEAHGVGRLVQLSALGADPDGDTAYVRSKGLAEELVRESELEWVVFRPSVVFGDGGEFIPYTKRLAPPYVTPLPGGGTTRFQPIWVGDLVPMLAEAIEGDGDRGEDGSDDGGDEAVDDGNEDPHVGETYEVGGPEVLTLAELAELAHGADGRSVGVVSIPMSIAGVGLRSLDHVPGSVLDALPGVPRMGSDQFRSLQFDNTVDHNDVSAFGVDTEDLLTVAAYLESDASTDAARA